MILSMLSIYGTNLGKLFYSRGKLLYSIITFYTLSSSRCKNSLFYWLHFEELSLQRALYDTFPVSHTVSKMGWRRSPLEMWDLAFCQLEFQRHRLAPRSTTFALIQLMIPLYKLVIHSCYVWSHRVFVIETASWKMQVLKSPIFSAQALFKGRFFSEGTWCKLCYKTHTTIQPAPTWRSYWGLHGLKHEVKIKKKKKKHKM